MPRPGDTHKGGVSCLSPVLKGEKPQRPRRLLRFRETSGSLVAGVR